MKNILLIGGSYGIGLSIVDELENDYNIFVASRTNESLANLNVTHIPFDVTTSEIDLALLPEQLHGFVYCPGSINLKPFKGIKPSVFEEDFQLNFMGAVKTLQRILPLLTAADQSSVVLFSTVAVGKGMPFHTSVSASKGAIEGFSRAFAAEYAPKIRVNVVAPSISDTPLANKFLNNDVKKEKSAERHPLKRVGEPKDAAAMACFLLSDKSSWITGQVFNVDGGMSSLITNG